VFLKIIDGSGYEVSAACLFDAVEVVLAFRKLLLGTLDFSAGLSRSPYGQ
jgi:hypothetical protein